MRHNSQNVSASLQGRFSKNPRSGGFCQSAGGFVEIKAYAKINLFLEVAGKRQDGYHNLISVMQRLDLHDTLCISHGENGVSLETNMPGLATGDNNLVIKAAKLLMQECGINQPLHIKLQKKIPMGAGLGGGSSNAAATLHGLNQRFGLDIPLSDLLKMGQILGADVPFCLLGGTALAEGIGEKLTPLNPHPHCYIVLACPPIHVSTKEIFQKLKNYSTENSGSFLKTYESNDISLIAKKLFNAFTSVTAKMHPLINTLISDLQNNGALGAGMTGTGSTVFAYFNNEHNAQKACNILEQHHKDTKFFVTQPR